MSNVIKIGYAQRAIHSNNLNENLELFIEDVKSLALKGANVICTQELFLSQYFCFEENQSHFDLALELSESEVVSKLQKVALEMDVVLLLSLFEKRTKGIYHNTAVVIDADGINLGMYRKMHIPDDPGYYEKYYFTPGDLGYQAFDTKYGCFGILICWDQWFPEAARLTVMKGVDVLFYPTAIGWDLDESQEVKEEELNAWLTVQKSHAISNGVFVVSVNRVGTENGVQFWGNSFICNPMGRLLVSSPSAQDDLVTCELDLDSIEKTRRVWPFFRDRRTDSYNQITEKFLK